ncbi:MAG: ROK family transcriptional regulator [Microbacteriaceae bacterium]
MSQGQLPRAAARARNLDSVANPTRALHQRDTTAGDLLRLISDGAPRTRSQLVETTGLARAAVSARVDSLLERGLVIPYDHAPSSGGRPPARVVFNPRVRLIVAIDLGASHANVAVTDLNGVTLGTRTERIDIADGPVIVLGHSLDVAEEILAGLDASPADVAGIGVGVPGPVAHATGRPMKPPIMPGWDAFDIPAHVSARIAATVLVDNDVNLLALGEHAATFPDVDDLIYVKVSTGIGAGVVSGGELQRGALGAAGDLGHVQVPHFHGRADTTTPGDLESIASGAAIVRDLAAAGRQIGSVSELVELLVTNDPEAIEMSRTAGRHVGEVVATCVNLLNPAVIVLGGSVATAGQEMLAGVREIVYRRSLPLATVELDIVQAARNGTGGVLGAALMLRNHLLAADRIDEFITGIDPVTTA